MKLKIKTYFMAFILLGVFHNSQAEEIKTQQVKPADSRTIIWLSADEKAALLQEMRNFLIASQKILQASLTEDMDAVESAARPVGMKLLKSTPEAIRKKLPTGFTDIGPRAHMGFEEIANEATGMGDREVVLEKLANLQKLCISCHAAYRFEVK